VLTTPAVLADRLPGPCQEPQQVSLPTHSAKKSPSDNIDNRDNVRQETYQRSPHSAAGADGKRQPRRREAPATQG
jgi:hypothetical protein